VRTEKFWISSINPAPSKIVPSNPSTSLSGVIHTESATSTSISNQFIVPLLNPKQVWSSPIPTKEKYALFFRSLISTTTYTLYVPGVWYDATTTNPVADVLSGDSESVDYFLEKLNALGYDDLMSLDLDANLDLTDASSANAKYELQIVFYDGPRDAYRSYMKTRYGKIRVIGIWRSGGTTKGVFVSDIVDVKQLAQSVTPKI